MKKVMLGCACLVCATMLTGCVITQKQVRQAAYALIEAEIDNAKEVGCESYKSYLDSRKADIKAKLLVK